MSKNDQEEYLRLYMQYKNLVEVPDSWKSISTLLQSEAEKDLGLSNGVISSVHEFIDIGKPIFKKF